MFKGSRIIYISVSKAAHFKL